MELTIRTDNKWRVILNEWDLTAKEKAEFWYLDWDGIDCLDFIRYRGILYDLSQFMPVSPIAPTPMGNWDGYSPDSYFSGVTVKYHEENGHVKMGTYLS